MRADAEVRTETSGDGPLRWTWVAIGAGLGSTLVGLFLYLVDPGLERLDRAGFIVALTVLLMGILVGYRSRGETVREAGLAGLGVLLVTAAVAVGVLKLRAPIFVWLSSPFYMMLLALLGGWVGEMLQGTVEEAHDDDAIDWLWVFVSVVIGFAVSSYAIFIGQSLVGWTPAESVVVFAASFALTGWLVGYFSPGVTMIEPGIAAAFMIVLDAGFVILWFEGGPPTSLFVVGFGGGAVMALLGGWAGEVCQRAVIRRRRIGAASAEG